MSRNLTCAAITALAALAFTQAAGAETRLAQAGAPQGNSFESLDKNSDGKLSLDEASANDKLFTLFKGLDGNKDGFLSKAEFAAYNPASASES
jgi:hypothetical protein